MRRIEVLEPDSSGQPDELFRTCSSQFEQSTDGPLGGWVAGWYLVC